MNKLMSFILSYVVKMDFLDGYRSYIAGAGFVLGGAAIIANQVAGGVWDDATMEKGLASLFAGFAILGRAGKSDKMIEAAKTTATATSATALSTATKKDILTAGQDVHSPGEARVD